LRLFLSGPVAASIYTGVVQEHELTKPKNNGVGRQNCQCAQTCELPRWSVLHTDTV
jgi:hypothetical protein